MYEIHIKGNKIAALLVWTNAFGYGEPYITFMEGSDENFVMHCEIETKFDENPYGYTEKEWNGEKADLLAYTEDEIQSGEYRYCFANCGLSFLSGFLNVEIEMLNRPDDSINPYCTFTHYADGRLIEEYECKNSNFYKVGQNSGNLQFDKWHDFDF